MLAGRPGIARVQRIPDVAPYHTGTRVDDFLPSATKRHGKRDGRAAGGRRLKRRDRSDRGPWSTHPSTRSSVPAPGQSTSWRWDRSSCTGARYCIAEEERHGHRCRRRHRGARCRRDRGARPPGLSRKAVGGAEHPRAPCRRPRRARWAEHASGQRRPVVGRHGATGGARCRVDEPDPRGDPTPPPLPPDDEERW